MKIGVLITCEASIGGTYHYNIALLNALRDYGDEHEYVVFYTDRKFPNEKYTGKNFTFCHYQYDDIPSLRKSVYDIACSLLGKILFLPMQPFPPILTSKHFRILREHDLDLIIGTAPDPDPVFAEIKYLQIIHDVSFLYPFPGHKPSVSAENYRQARTLLGAFYSAKIITESTLGKRQIIDNYRLQEDKVAILPTPPADFVWREQPPSVAGVYDLPDNYIFYPAHFMEFKNHARIIEALAIIEDKAGLAISAVFCGTYKDDSYLANLNKIITDKGLINRIIFIDHVADRHMPGLYKGALALCMASYVGPTNMPIWEALVLGCPVIASNIGDMPWQVGGAGFIFDPDNAEQLALQIRKIYENPALRAEMIDRGYERTRFLNPAVWGESLMKIVNDTLENICSK